MIDSPAGRATPRSPLPEVAVVIGTRPEAIKMFPVIRALRLGGRLVPFVVSTGQHRELLASAFEPLGIRPEASFDLMRPDQSLDQLTSRVVERVGDYLDRRRPAAVLVQGDTTTVLAASLASFHHEVPVGHVEAGLRTYDLTSPFPEECNRQLVDRIARWCFAPTEPSRDNLLEEGIPEQRVFVTGNTAIDTLLFTLERLGLSPEDEEDVVLLTLHRRESFGEPLARIVTGIRWFLESRPDARVIWPVHPNPNVAGVARELGGLGPRVELVAPLPYDDFVACMARARVILSDSGGVQEEAPSLGKSVLVAREMTERPEGLSAGNRIVGRDSHVIRDALEEAWSAHRRPLAWPAPNPFGDGKAGERIARIVAGDVLEPGSPSGGAQG